MSIIEKLIKEIGEEVVSVASLYPNVQINVDFLKDGENPLYDCEVGSRVVTTIEDAGGGYLIVPNSEPRISIPLTSHCGCDDTFYKRVKENLVQQSTHMIKKYNAKLIIIAIKEMSDSDTNCLIGAGVLALNCDK
jgi:hypothetical protein